MVTTSTAYNLALRHWWIASQGGSVKCPYDPGTKARKIYDNQIKRMETLSNGY